MRSLLEEFLKPLGISQSAFAVRLGVSFPRLNEIVRGRWVVVDEVQRMPALLNEVQALVDRILAPCLASSGQGQGSGERAVGIEVKSRSTWRPEYSTALKGLVEQGVVKHAHGAYTGTAERKDGPVRVWPVRSFLRELTQGTIFA